jgi:5-methylcytosine-specific restriction endonuclease McrA
MQTGKRTLTFSTKTREAIITRDNAHCQAPGCHRRYEEIHHIVSNSVMYRRIYGKLIQSKDNGVCVCKSCHQNHSFWDDELKEALIKKWKKFSKSKIKEK